jgi:hypothetical protein
MCLAVAFVVPTHTPGNSVVEGVENPLTFHLPLTSRPFQELSPAHHAWLAHDTEGYRIPGFLHLVWGRAQAQVSPWLHLDVLFLTPVVSIVLLLRGWSQSRDSITGSECPSWHC